MDVFSPRRRGPGDFKRERRRSNISNRAARPEDLASISRFAFLHQKKSGRRASQHKYVDEACRYFLGLLLNLLYFWSHFQGLRFSLSPDCVLTLRIKTGFNGVLNKVPVDQNSASAVSPLHIRRGADRSLSGERSAQCRRSSPSTESIMVCCQRPLPACAWKPVIWGEHFNLICFAVCKGAFREIKKKKSTSPLTVRF